MSEPNAALADFYGAGYRPPSPEEGARLGRWRALGAELKADHVVTLLGRAGVSPASLVEIGCGDGALLSALALRGVTPVLDGFELSVRAAELARARTIAGARRIEAYDGVRLPSHDDEYGLALLSHVLEHAPLLAEAARVARWVVVEVPLEDNVSARRAAKRTEAARIGHVQAFSRASVGELLAGCGLRPVAALTDALPRSQHAFFARGRGDRARAHAKWALRSLVHTAAPSLAERAFTLHYAVIAHRDTGSGGLDAPRRA